MTTQALPLLRQQWNNNFILYIFNIDQYPVKFTFIYKEESTPPHHRLLKSTILYRQRERGDFSLSLSLARHSHTLSRGDSHAASGGGLWQDAKWIFTQGQNCTSPRTPFYICSTVLHSFTLFTTHVRQPPLLKKQLSFCFLLLKINTYTQQHTRSRQTLCSLSSEKHSRRPQPTHGKAGHRWVRLSSSAFGNSLVQGRAVRDEVPCAILLYVRVQCSRVIYSIEKQMF